MTTTPKPKPTVDRRVAAAVLLIVACVGGCTERRPDDSPSADPDSNATPGNVFRKLKTAAAREDWASFFAVFSRESQRIQLNVYLFDLEKQSQQAGPKCHQEFREFLASQRLDTPPVRREDSDDELKQRFANVTNLSGCLASAIAWAGKHAGELPKRDPLGLDGFRKLGRATLRDAAIRGDRAILTIRLDDGKSVQMSLRQVGEDWNVDTYHK